MKNITHKLIAFSLVSFLFFSCAAEDEDGIYFNNTKEVEISAKVSYSVMETQILDLVNDYRKGIDLPALTRLDIVSSVAGSHTNYMIQTGVVSHDNFQQRAATLQNNANAKAVGENVAYGFGTAQGVVNGWLNSSEHKKIIENPNYTHFGISTEADNEGRNYFTQIFMSKK